MKSSRPGYLPNGQKKHSDKGCARHDPPRNLLYKCACPKFVPLDKLSLEEPRELEEELCLPEYPLPGEPGYVERNPNRERIQAMLDRHAEEEIPATQVYSQKRKSEEEDLDSRIIGELLDEKVENLEIIKQQKKRIKLLESALETLNPGFKLH